MTIFGREPAAIAAFIAIAINLGITFGLNLTVEQVAIINALVVAGLGLIVRQAVTPTVIIRSCLTATRLISSSDV